jgi:hypothetical protein
MKIKTLSLISLVAASVMLSFAAHPAQAAKFNLDNTNDDANNGLELEQQPWWKKSSLVKDLAGTVGLFSSINETPLFVSSDETSVIKALDFESTDLVSGQGVTYLILSGDAASLLNKNIMELAAPAAPPPSAVPEPLTIIGAITAAGFGVVFKRKKNSNKEK